MSSTVKQKIYIDPKFHFHPKYKEIYKKVQTALKQFPEIKIVYLSAFYPTKTIDKQTIAWVEGEDYPGIAFNVHTLPTYDNIYHELWHIVQRGRKSTAKKTHKHIEAEATLLGMARLKPSQVENNFMTYVNTVPKSKVIHYGKYAQREKEKGNKHFVSDTFFKMENDKKKELKKNPKNSKRWKIILSKDYPTNAKFNTTVKGKNYTKSKTPSKVNASLRKNIRKSQQLNSNLFNPGKSKVYLYSKSDLIKIPSWMKSKSKRKTSKVNKTKLSA